MPKQSYHFDIGNSSSGPIGFCARVNASSPEEALKFLRDRLPEEVAVDDFGEDDGMDEGEYIRVYLNGAAVAVTDIDEVDDVEED